LVRVERGELTIVDLGSRNGTYVNGARIDRTTLAAGDCIGVGGVLLWVSIGTVSYAEPNHPTLLGKSPALAKLLEEIATVATHTLPVTLLGETGTGKELVARAIHQAGGRRGSLVVVNCGALAEGVLESELFGHVQGAFTGAAGARPGLVLEAEGGTLFLDEVTATPPRLQTVLLRLLENATYRRVGGNEEITADVRVVAAGQPDLIEATTSGRFRPDLWHRLSRRVVQLPPLCDRRQDIPLLARLFARQIRPAAELTPELSLALLRASWPGNVRQLRNVAERLAELSGDDVLSDTSLVPRDDAGGHALQAPGKIRLRRPKRGRPSRVELERLLDELGGRIAGVADRLHVDRKTVYRWLDAYAIDRGEPPAAGSPEDEERG
jgi:DNA-binding NtrC family response regulator